MKNIILLNYFYVYFVVVFNVVAIIHFNHEYAVLFDNLMLFKRQIHYAASQNPIVTTPRVFSMYKKR